MIDRITIIDHVQLGQKICEWSTNPATRPATFNDLKVALQGAGIATFPPRITKVVWVDTPLDTFVVRVPNPQMVAESIHEMMDDPPSQEYPMMEEYRAKICVANSGMSNLDFLYTRIADYTIAQCK